MSIVKKITDFLICDIAGGFIPWMYGKGCGTYDKCVNQAFNFLTKSPQEWCDGTAFAQASLLFSTSFKVLGILLVSIFFLIGYVGEVVDTKQDVRFEAIFKMIIKLLLAQYLVVNSFTMVTNFCEMATYLVSSTDRSNAFIGGSMDEDGNITIDTETISAYIYSVDENGKKTPVAGVGDAMGSLVASLIFAAGASASGLMILYQAFIRFFKLILVMPYGGIACSTAAGNHVVNRTTEAFFKYVLCIIFESVTMCIALNLTGAVVRSFSGSLFGSSGLWEKLLCDLFMCLCTVGVVKSAEQITERALGLH